MPRPKKDIRITYRADRGAFYVAFREHPDHWYAAAGDDEAAALKWAKRNRDRLIMASEGQGPTMRNLAAGFFDDGGAWDARMRAKGQEIGRRHLENYAAILRNHLLPAFGDLRPAELTARGIDDAILEMRKKNGEPLTSATRYKLTHCFGLVLGDLSERGILERNPLAGVKPYSKRPTKPRGALTREVLAALFPTERHETLRVWGRSMWAAYFGLAYDTGMRPGEIRALTWSRVYAAEGAVVVRAAEKKGGGMGETKNGAVRAGRLSARTLQELAIWRLESRFNGDADLVFTLDGKKPVTDAAAHGAFKKAVAAIGKAKEGASWTPYWLRHSFVTYALASLDAREVALLAGHSEAISQAVYAHPDDEIVLRATAEARRKLEQG